MINVIGLRFKPVGKIYFFDPCGEQFNVGDAAVVETARGIECGTVAQKNHDVLPEQVIEPLKKVIRKANADDLKRLETNARREKEAFKVCSQKITERGLEMRLVDVECAFDGSNLLFYFTADGRIDFRELVKTLAGEFKTRIELRQIGPRDEVKILGGLGPCGRPCCCTKNAGDFEHVSIKMAKTQGLSLNPTSISGLCGRLMCCLSYENAHYAETQKLMPKVGSEVETPKGKGVVLYNDLLARTVDVKIEDDKLTFALNEIKFKKPTQSENSNGEN